MPSGFNPMPAKGLSDVGAQEGAAEHAGVDGVVGAVGVVGAAGVVGAVGVVGSAGVVGAGWAHPAKIRMATITPASNGTANLFIINFSFLVSL